MLTVSIQRPAVGAIEAKSELNHEIKHCIQYTGWALTFRAPQARNNSILHIIPSHYIHNTICLLPSTIIVLVMRWWRIVQKYKSTKDTHTNQPGRQYNRLLLSWGVLHVQCIWLYNILVGHGCKRYLSLMLDSSLFCAITASSLFCLSWMCERVRESVEHR